MQNTVILDMLNTTINRSCLYLFLCLTEWRKNEFSLLMVTLSVKNNTPNGAFDKENPNI